MGGREGRESKEDEYAGDFPSFPRLLPPFLPLLGTYTQGDVVGHVVMPPAETVVLAYEEGAREGGRKEEEEEEVRVKKSGQTTQTQDILPFFRHAQVPPALPSSFLIHPLSSSSTYQGGSG